MPHRGLLLAAGLAGLAAPVACRPGPSVPTGYARAPCLAARDTAHQVVGMRVVAPDTLRLAVGERYPLCRIRIETWDVAGRRIGPYFPGFAIRDLTVLDLDRAVDRPLAFVGRAPGRTVITFAVARPGPTPDAPDLVDLAELVVVVHE